MASELDHVALANKNHDCLLHLASNPAAFPEWVTTIAFYKAVHVVEAVFANLLGMHSTSHDNRQYRLKTDPKLKSGFVDYQALMTASRIARYLEASSGGRHNTYRAFSDSISPSDVMSQLVYKRLHRVEQFMLPFLSDDGRARLKKIVPPPKPTTHQAATTIQIPPATSPTPAKNAKRRSPPKRP